MYLRILLITAFSLVSTDAFSDLCGQNVTLNTEVSTTLSNDNIRLMPAGVCRIVVRPSNTSFLMAVYLNAESPLVERTENMCNIVTITHRENTYNLCHLEPLPAMDHEFVIEVHDKELVIVDTYNIVWMTMTVFYEAQCQHDAEMCATQEDDTHASYCDTARKVRPWGGPTYTECTDQQAQDCPHRCGVCSNGSAASCCFNGWYQRHVTRGTVVVESMGICKSYPYGCSRIECDENCDVGKANGPFCVAVLGAVAFGDGGEHGGGFGGGGEHGGGGSFGGGSSDTARVGGDGVDGDGVDGGDVNSGVGKKSENMTKSEGNGMGGNWAAVGGIIIVLNA